MVKCAVKYCVSRSEKDGKINGITFHKVPKDQRREEWIRIIRLLRKETDWLPSTATVICSKHFKDQDRIPPKHDKGHTKLSNKAIPMVIDDTKSQLEMEVDLNVETDDEMLEILESPREHKMRKTIKRLKFVSSKRLKCIKNLMQKNKRLLIKNKELSDIIKELKKQRYLREEEEESKRQLYKKLMLHSGI